MTRTFDKQFRCLFRLRAACKLYQRLQQLKMADCHEVEWSRDLNVVSVVLIKLFNLVLCRGHKKSTGDVRSLKTWSATRQLLVLKLGE